MKKSIFLQIVFVVVCLLASDVVRGQASYPVFDESYWSGQRSAASGKMFRGVAGIALGLGLAVPSSIWVNRAFDNPHKYAAVGAVAAIGSISLALHGVNSIVFGAEERDTASGFVEQYRLDPASVSLREQQRAYLHSKKKSAAKVVAFGAVLTGQGALLLVDGMVLGIKKIRGDSIGGARIWPPFVFGGLLLAGGVTLMVLNVKRYREFDKLNISPAPVVSGISVQPWFCLDHRSSLSAFGLSGQFAF